MTIKVKQNWWEEQDGFFGPEYFRQYNGTILTEDDTVHQVDFIENVLQTRGAFPYSNKKLTFLDVPCGHGRHAIELASRTTDYEVTGYELNSFFLRQAEKAAHEKFMYGNMYGNGKKGVKVNWLQGDMRTLPFHEEFHIVLNLFTAMGYFGDDQEDEKFFASVYHSLKPGGAFMIDYLNRDRLLKNFQPKDWRSLPDGSIVINEREYDAVKGLMNDRRITLEENKVVRDIASTIRFYAPRELIAMAARVGLSLESAYGDFEGKPLTVDSKRTILIFRKPKNV